MAQSQVTYTAVNDGKTVGGMLFDGKSFWIAQRCPLRADYISKVWANGGKIVQLERMADYLIVDHLKNGGVPGGISYKFIDESIRNGVLTDPEAHLADTPKGAVRDVGSSTRPAKSTRTKFSEEDDRVLFKFVMQAESQGARILGNDIYKQLELLNPRHTWQSWRDRWVKYLQNRVPTGWETADIKYEASSAAALSSKTPPARSSGQSNRTSSASPSAVRQRVEVGMARRRPENAPVSKSDATSKSAKAAASENNNTILSADVIMQRVSASSFLGIWEHASEIMQVPSTKRREGWEGVAEAYSDDNLTPDAWEDFFKSVVAPFYQKFQEQELFQFVLDALKEWVEENPDQKAVDWFSFFNKQVRPQVMALKLDLERNKDARLLLDLAKSPALDSVLSGAEAISASLTRKRAAAGDSYGNDGGEEDGHYYKGDAPSHQAKKARPNEDDGGDSDDAFEDAVEVQRTAVRIQAAIKKNVPIRQEVAVEDEEVEEDEEEVPGSSPPLYPRLPNSASLNTQAILQAETQQIDLDIPEPDEGFEGGDEEDIGVVLPIDRLDEGHNGVDYAEDEDLDLRPPGDDFEGFDQRLPDSDDIFVDGSEEEDENDDDDEYGESQVDFAAVIAALEDEGHPPTAIATALQATNANMRLARVVLEALSEGSVVPGGIRGIWTARDDSYLETGEKKHMFEIQRKHGIGGCRARRLFLDLMSR